MTMEGVSSSPLETFVGAYSDNLGLFRTELHLLRFQNRTLTASYAGINFICSVSRMELQLLSFQDGHSSASFSGCTFICFVFRMKLHLRFRDGISTASFFRMEF